MNYLLDTHTLLWALFDPKKLSSSVRDAIISQENYVAVSVVSFWEISLKFALGKLELYGVMPDELSDYMDQMDIEVIPIHSLEAVSFYRLPRLEHKDPFDRMIVWQAIQRKLILISKDLNLKKYQQFGLKAYCGKWVE